MDEETSNSNNNMRSDCPVCGGKNTLQVTSKTDNIPYFGDILETTVNCEKCGYQSSDNISLEQNDPSRYTMEISNEKLDTRIAKSQTATVTIPELGLKVEPGPKSQGYVSNVEGILTRFEEAVERALKLESDDVTPEIEENASSILEMINEIKLGNFSTILILEDPFGNSVIDDEDAHKDLLTPEEVELLNTGFATIDMDDLEGE